MDMLGNSNSGQVPCDWFGAVAALALTPDLRFMMELLRESMYLGSDGPLLLWVTHTQCA